MKPTSSRSRAKVALISATPTAIPPAVDGLAEGFPEADIWNLLDDRLLGDLEAQGGFTPALEARMHRLIDHAIEGGADGVLLTCSQYGPLAASVRAPIPVLAPDEAAFEAIARSGWSRVLVLASVEGSLVDTLERLSASLRRAGVEIGLEGACSRAALEAAKRGDRAGLDSALLAAAQPYAGRVDAVLLAQFSLTSAAAAPAAALDVPIVTGPHTAAESLRRRIAS